MLQALHGVIKVGGQRMSEKHKDEILSTLITLQGTAHELHRSENYPSFFRGMLVILMSS